MTDLVREHRFQLRFGQLLNKRVEENNFSETAKAGEERVGMTRPLAAVHHLNAFGKKPGALAQ